MSENSDWNVEDTVDLVSSEAAAADTVAGKQGPISIIEWFLDDEGRMDKLLLTVAVAFVGVLALRNAHRQGGV